MEPTAILDFQKPLDVSLLDAVVDSFYGGTADPKIQAILVSFQNDPQAWMRVDSILASSKSMNTKLLALTILTKCVKERWKIIPPQQREGIKNYVVSMIVRMSSEHDDKIRAVNKQMLSRLNILLVQILKQEWPHNWPSFIPDLVKSSKQNENLCANNMAILQRLSEDIFDAAEEEMTQKKLLLMKSSLNREFSQIYKLCIFILQRTHNIHLLRQSFETLLRFLSWIPMGFVFEPPLLELLCLRYMPVEMFREKVLQCLTEIGTMDFSKNKKAALWTNHITRMFQLVITTMTKIVPPDTDVAAVVASGNKNADRLIRVLTNFITGVCSRHIHALEAADPHTQNCVLISHRLLLKISEIPDQVVFKICLDYWISLVKSLYKEKKKSIQPILIGRAPAGENVRLSIYSQILSNLRLVLISRMVRPKEVLITEDDNGNVVKEAMKDTELLNLYKSMKECLVYLTHLDPQDTQQMMISKLSKQIDGSEYSWHNLNTLCWAMGSIAGSMVDEQEKTFLVHVIKDLLGLCEQKRGKDHKAVIASNIMYVVGQYPRFLKEHWKFLKTVVNKLFEFMHEKFPGVQDMAVETFLKIAKKCRREFVKPQPKEAHIFVVEILMNLQETIKLLEDPQVHVFYEALGHVIGAEENRAKQQELVFRLMKYPNATWSNIVTTANTNVQILWVPETIKAIINVLKTNQSVATALGHGYIVQLGRIYLEMLHVYKAYSEFVSGQIQSKGVIVTQETLIRQMRTVKSETLRLITTFIERSRSDDAVHLTTSFLPALMAPVLHDYRNNVPNARDAEVLSLFAALINKLSDNITESIPTILEAIFECTLEMITKNMEDYPDHRLKFFRLVQAVNSKCFRAFFKMDVKQFQYVIDSMTWALKHLDRNVADTGLEMLLKMVQNVENTKTADNFYRGYMMSLIEDVIAVLTDTFHKSGFILQAKILAKLFSIVESGSVTVPLWPQGQEFPNNQVYLRQYVISFLSKQFQQVTRAQVEQFVQGMFNTCGDQARFKIHLRDFLVELKEFNKTDNIDMFPEKAQARAATLPPGLK